LLTKTLRLKHIIFSLLYEALLFLFIVFFLYLEIINWASVSLQTHDNIFCQIFFNTDKGFKKLCQQSFQLLFIWHLSQFWQNVQTFCNISDQKNCYDKRASVTSLFKCLIIVESCVYWISSVWRDSKFSIQCLSQKSNFSSLLRKHFVMNTLILSTVENDLCFSQIDWQSSLYNSSSASAFTYICLRSVILLNKFWSCMSTEINMSATVIEAVCIGLFIISEYIICIVQCCTLSFERFINTFCYCFDKASALSFCLLSKYSMKKLYYNSIKDHLICCSVSFLTVIKYFRFLWFV